MAGRGARFQRAGYAMPKPLIPVRGRPMIQWMVEGLQLKGDFIFIVQKDHYDNYALEQALRLIDSNCKIICIDTVTEGAACTTLLARELVNTEVPLVIADSDHHLEWDSNKFMDLVADTTADAYTLVFKASSDKHSYVRVDEKNNVIEVAEKKVISDLATCGVHYWKKGSDYVTYAEQMIGKNIRTNNEFYICPVYNEALLDNKKITAYSINKMWGMGTPEELDHFLKNHTGNN